MAAMLKRVLETATVTIIVSALAAVVVLGGVLAATGDVSADNWLDDLAVVTAAGLLWGIARHLTAGFGVDGRDAPPVERRYHPPEGRLIEAGEPGAAPESDYSPTAGIE